MNNMNEKKKSKYIGMLGALVVHLVFLALLLLVSFVIPEKEEESGVEVMLGDVRSAYGGFDPSSLVDVDIMNRQETQARPQPTAEQELITQTDEETVAVKPNSNSTRETRTPEQIQEQRAAEAQRTAAETAEHERKAAEEQARQRVAGAFGRGAQMGDRGENTGTGSEGTPDGNSAAGGNTGSGEYGDFDLGGRTLNGSLPKPVYNVQDEGRVVVSITVNPGGYVIATSINRLTNTVNPALRKAAEDAAKKARFSSAEGLNNQTGTITYYFNLK